MDTALSRNEQAAAHAGSADHADHAEDGKRSDQADLERLSLFVQMAEDVARLAPRPRPLTLRPAPAGVSLVALSISQ